MGLHRVGGNSLVALRKELYSGEEMFRGGSEGKEPLVSSDVVSLRVCVCVCVEV